MNDTIYDEIIKRRDNRQCRKNERKLKSKIEEYAIQVKKPSSEWTDRDVFDFVYLWDKKFEHKPRTVKVRFDRIMKICKNANWAIKAKEDPANFKELVNMYLRIRAERSNNVRITAQAPEISLSTARAVAGKLLASNKNTNWEQQLCHIRLLALSFSFVGGCRVGDLHHIRWGKIFEGKLEDSPAIYALLDWSKTNPYGLREDDFRIFPAFNHKVLCPVTLWRMLSTCLPQQVPPFHSIRTGKPVQTDVIVRGWKAAAISLNLDAHFSAHSCRRTRITRMRELGLSDCAIKKILGYSDKSQMPSHYDVKKRKGNKAAIEKEIKAYLSQISKS